MKQTGNESTQSIILDAVDTKGRPGKVQLRTRIIGPEKAGSNSKESVNKSYEDKPVSSDNDEEDISPTFSSRYGLIKPPYDLLRLAMMREESTELGQVIQAMVTNTVGFGFQIKEKAITEKDRKLLGDEIEKERHDIDAKLAAFHATESLTMLRSKVMWDKHACGNGYLELIENRRGDLVGGNHIPGHSIRTTKKQEAPTKVYLQLVRPDKGYQIEQIPMWHRFRRYAQVSRYGATTRITWFKSAGDIRQMDKRTGRYAKEGETIPFKYRATSLIHDSLYNPTGPYGVPHFIGNILSILGSRGADEINYNTINSNAIPSMVITVENGALTEGSIARLREFTEEQIMRTDNYSKFLLIEGETVDEGSPNPSSFRIKIDPLTQVQHDDMLFQEYDANNRDKIRQSYRLPPIFVGRSDDYTRSTADTSRDIADEQVFSPERNQADYYLNRFVLPSWGVRFHKIQSNTPNITDDIELVRLMAIAEKSGGMNPRIAYRIVRDVFGADIGPMPKGIDPDIPFSIQFAQAQVQGRIGGGQGGSSIPEKLIADLVSVAEKTESALLKRFFERD